MHPVADDHIAAPIDPGIPQRSFTEKDFEGEAENWFKVPICFSILIKQKYQFASRTKSTFSASTLFAF